MRRPARHTLLTAGAVLLALIGVALVVLRTGDDRAPSNALSEAVADDPVGVWWSTEIEGAGAPGSPDRVRHLLTEVAWNDGQAAALARGLAESTATLADAAPDRYGAARDRARALLVGIGGTDRDVDVRLQPAVLDFLQPWTGAMNEVLTGMIVPAPPNADPAATTEAGQVALALWYVGSDPIDVSAPEEWLVDRDVLLDALANLGDDADAVAEFVRAWAAWTAPLASAELAAGTRAEMVGLEWFAPIADAVVSFSSERCVDEPACLSEQIATLVGPSALRAAYDAVQPSLLPERVVVGGERVVWNKLDQNQRAALATWWSSDAYPGPREFCPGFVDSRGACPAPEVDVRGWR
ncbi:hypothetical protein [Nocardioides zeae]|uniref:Uncharacterized protein n=1 Tax=Nocardioides zeae TaxID=1457234 RepID=A0A6P0HLJ6_9ACTN|nr:hypothetical protein [Nocardioides zeae]NEN79471.1 hypothetical protein [Nocardioides zeae]